MSLRRITKLGSNLSEPRLENTRENSITECPEDDSESHASEESEEATCYQEAYDDVRWLASQIAGELSYGARAMVCGSVHSATVLAWCLIFSAGTAICSAALGIRTLALIIALLLGVGMACRVPRYIRDLN